MERKLVLITLIAVLLTGVFGVTFKVEKVRASGTIYIRADGSIEPLTANITTADNVTYTLTGNINDSIVIERDNIVVDGVEYTVQGLVSGTGISLDGRSNVTIKNMEIKAFQCGISLWRSSNNSISGNHIANNDLGMQLDESSNNIISENNITTGNEGIILIYSSDYNSIAENNISNNNYGVCLAWDSNSNSIFGNNITNKWRGIFLSFSTYYNNITGNTITNNGGFGIWFYQSSNNIISENTITNNDWDGIELEYSNYNTVSGNTITNNGVEGGGGITLYLSSSNNSISGNTITANKYLDILLSVSSNYNSICDNNVTNSMKGIILHESSYNSVYGNNVANNGIGIRLYSSSENKFYHNNFIANTQQVYVATPGYANFWDNSYPSGGNYWSDYNETDIYSGPYQNETGCDGIGDTPYVIDASNQDNYPIINPVTSVDIAVINVIQSKTVVGQSYCMSINVTIENQGGFAENLSVTVYANTTEISTFSNITLTSGNSITITLHWTNVSIPKGNYTINAYAWPVPGEGDTEDNTLFNGWIFVTIPGDVDGDRDVDIYDVVKITGIYHSKLGDPQFKPNSDLDCNGEIEIYDVVMCTSHYGQSW